MNRFAGIGQGTRVTKTLDEKSEYRTYIIQAIIGAIACDFVLLNLIIIMLGIGWPALFVISLLVTYYGVLFIADRMNLTTQQAEKLAYAFAISICISDFFFIRGWWDWLICRELIWLFIIETITPLRMSKYVYFSLLGLWFFGALKAKGRITLTLIIAALFIWTIYGIQYTVDFLLLWSRLRYFGTVLLIPWPVFGLILAAVMIKEMIAPNLNFVLGTIDFKEYREIGGLIGLWFPKLLGTLNELKDRITYKITTSMHSGIRSQAQQKRRDWFGPTKKGQKDGLARFGIALLTDRATFSEKGSRKNSKKPKLGAVYFGYTQDEYVELREIGLELGLIVPQGKGYELSASGIGTMLDIIEQTLGYDAIPDDYKDHSPTP